MNKTQVAQLLTVLSGYDRRQVDEITVEAWHAIPEIARADYDTALQVVIAHQTGTEAAEYFQVRHLAAGLRRRNRNTRGDVETDVRSAKARGLIDPSHPLHEPLPDDVAQKLADARERDRQEAIRYTREISA